jgi:hypothetical protein
MDAFKSLVLLSILHVNSRPLPRLETFPLPECHSPQAMLPMSKEVANEQTDVVGDAMPNCLSREFAVQCLGNTDVGQFKG